MLARVSLRGGRHPACAVAILPSCVVSGTRRRWCTSEAPLLQGFKVVELASVLAGPSVGQFLAELGADVVKVENRRTRGDVTRGWRLPGEQGATTAYFSCCNAGKRSIAVDAGHPRGRELCQQLAAQADVVVASYKPGDAEKLGLDAETLRAGNPRLVYAQITGYGLESPRVGYDALVQAEAGFTYMNGEPDSKPTKMPVALVDLLAAHQLKEAILCALWRRDRTGQGSAVNCSLYAAAVASLANQATGWLCAGQVPQRMGSAHPSIYPYGSAFDDAAGLPVTLAVGSDAQFASLCRELGCPELAEDARFVRNADRVRHKEALQPLLAARFRAQAREELLPRLRRSHVPAGAIADMPAVFSQPLAEALVLRDASASDGPGAAMGLRQVAWRGDASRELRRPPGYGQHTLEILRELGLQETSISDLVACGAVESQ